MNAATSTVSDPYYMAATAQGTTASGPRQAAIRVAAYYHAEHRGFAPGHELDDWLLAEREIDAVQAARGTGR